MRRLLLLSTALLFTAAAMSQTAAKPKKPAHANPAAVHAGALVIDTHADTPQRLLDEKFDLATDTPVSEGHLDFGKAKAGNLGAEFFSIWVEPDLNKGHYAKRALDLIDSVYQQAEKHPDKMVMAFSTADIVKARTGPRKRFAALMGVEGGHAIENSLPVLRDFYRLGVRYMTLTWSNTNEWADSSGDITDEKVEHHKGLTPFGKQVVREMNRLGMMVDVSHVSDKTFYDTMLLSRAPVIASHSSSRVLTNHPRNMTDDMLRAMQRNGGVVMVNFFSAFIDEDFRKAFTAQAKDRNAAVKAAEQAYAAQHPGEQVPWMVADRVGKEWAAKLPRPPLKSLIDHIDHIAKVAGVDHVGLGSDFDGVSSLPAEIDSAADLPKITAALMQRGYTAADMKQVLGGNLLRVFREVERTSKQIHQEEATGFHRDPALEDKGQPSPPK
ncbi:MAG: membrane dipeptidase [Candidatus Koribacter versatilis]|uniref:Membrane dipeptidase n=1 Tax=Candidatus Korobacter versatilis TaxID=658062 RepID=A0A932A6T1_9BACT|nr:membrane dipeptidase [Candidatus Koribacter versatilis]